MPYIHPMEILLKEYNLWNVPRTFYEHWDFEDYYRVYMFACHQQHTNVKVKLDLHEFIEANT